MIMEFVFSFFSPKQSEQADPNAATVATPSQVNLIDQAIEQLGPDNDPECKLNTAKFLGSFLDTSDKWNLLTNDERMK